MHTAAQKKHSQMQSLFVHALCHEPSKFVNLGGAIGTSVAELSPKHSLSPTWRAPSPAGSVRENRDQLGASWGGSLPLHCKPFHSILSSVRPFPIYSLFLSVMAAFISGSSGPGLQMTDDRLGEDGRGEERKAGSVRPRGLFWRLHKMDFNCRMYHKYIVRLAFRKRGELVPLVGIQQESPFHH